MSLLVALIAAAVFVAAGSASAESLATSASSAGSSASSAGSASLRGSSDSLKSSSNSSSKEEEPVKTGEYRVTQVADVDGKPEMVLLTLAAAGHEADGFQLEMPRRAMGDRAFAIDDRIAARQRPYGVEFARTDAARQAFFLVVRNEWEKDLMTRPVLN